MHKLFRGSLNYSPKEYLPLFWKLIGALLFVDSISVITNPDLFGNGSVFSGDDAENFAIYRGHWSQLAHGAPLLLTSTCLTGVTLAAALMCGLYNTAIGFITFLVTSLLDGFNPYFNTGGDQYLRLITFFGTLLSMKAQSNSDFRFSMARLAYFSQIMLVYVFSAVHKYGDSWRVDYNALEMALRLKGLQGVMGSYLLQHSFVLKCLTLGGVLIQEICPLVIALFWKTRALRVIALCMIVTFHLASSLILTLGIFPFVCVVALIPLFPCYAKGTSCENIRPRREPVSASDIAFALSLVMLILCVIILNVSTLPGLRSSSIASSPPVKFARYMGLGQRWQLFAPNPPTIDGYVKVEVTFDDGSVVSLFPSGDQLLSRNGPPSRDSHQQGGGRHRYLYTILTNEMEKQFKHSFLRFIATNFQNGSGAKPPRIVKLVIYRCLFKGEGISELLDESMDL